MSRPQPVATAVPVPRYGAATRALHWLSALAVVAAWGVGLSQHGFPPGGPERDSVIAVHGTLGLLVLALSVLRLLGRRAVPAPPPEGTPRRVMMVRLGHAALYGVMIALPLTGLLTRWGQADEAVLIGGLTLPEPFEVPSLRLWGQLHRTIAWTLAVLVAAHAGSALYHHFVVRDGTLRRMLRPRAR